MANLNYPVSNVIWMILCIETNEHGWRSPWKNHPPLAWTLVNMTSNEGSWSATHESNTLPIPCSLLGSTSTFQVGPYCNDALLLAGDVSHVRILSQDGPSSIFMVSTWVLTIDWLVVSNLWLILNIFNHRWYVWNNQTGWFQIWLVSNLWLIFNQPDLGKMMAWATNHT